MQYKLIKALYIWNKNKGIWNLQAMLSVSNGLAKFGQVWTQIFKKSFEICGIT